MTGLRVRRNARTFVRFEPEVRDGTLYAFEFRKSSLVIGAKQMRKLLSLTSEDSVSLDGLVSDMVRSEASPQDRYESEDAVMIDSIAVGLRGIIQSRFKIGDNIVVSGAGPIGLGTIQWLKIAGARHITALEPSKKRGNSPSNSEPTGSPRSTASSGRRHPNSVIPRRRRKRRT